MLWIIKAHKTELAALLAAMLLSLIALMAWLSPYSGMSQNSVLSDSWRGHSQMLEKLQWGERPVTILSNLSNLRGNGVLVIVSPNSELPAAPLLSHLRRGGAILLADNSPYSDAFLSELGVERKVGLIVDKLHYFKREDAPLVSWITGPQGARYGQGERVALRRASPLFAAGNSTALLSSSYNSSWVDENLDGKINESDSRGPHNAALALSYNSSAENAVINADRYLFSNDMINERSNLAFLLDSLEKLDLKAEREVIVYEGRKAEPSQYLMLAMQGSAAFSSPYAIAGFVALFGILLVMLAVGKEEHQEGFTLFDRLVFGVSKNIGKRKAPYVWLMQKLQARLEEKIKSCERTRNVNKDAYTKARMLLAGMAGKDFSAMDALSLEAKIKEVSNVIAALEKRDGEK